MKIRLTNRAYKAASTLVIVLIIGAVLCVGVSYYLSLVQQQSLLSSRSQGWNLAISIAEAGIEEGLQQLNSNADHLAADGWAFDGTYYLRTNNMPNGGFYTISINYSTPNNPTMVARSFVNPTFATALFGVAANGGVAASTFSSKTITRAIRVTCARGSLFQNVLAAKDQIQLNGNGVMTDSYDSTDPSKSTNGKYDPTKYRGDMGDVASNDGITNALSAANANIYGHAHVGPGGTMTIGVNGGVGEHSWQSISGNSGKAETGWFAADANFTFPDTTFPYSSSSPGVMNTAAGGDVVTATGSNTTYRTTLDLSSIPSPTPVGTVTNISSTNLVTWAPGAYFTNTSVLVTTIYPTAGTYLGSVSSNFVSGVWKFTCNHITGYAFHYNSYTYPTYASTYTTNHYDHILGSGSSYYMNSLTGSTYVAGTDVKLVVANGIDLTQPFVISQSGAVQVWTGGTSVTLTGNEGANGSGGAGSFILYCAPSVTGFTLNGSAQFTGVIVAPSADLHLTGGGGGNTDFSGSLMVKSVILNGHFSFHYDEALRYTANKGRYLVTTWDEIP